MSETLNLQIPSPTFEGSTGGWLRAAEVEDAKPEHITAGCNVLLHAMLERAGT